ncbi:hypothetical protein PRZ48_009587 [Zasmidium cellare]|uniref:Uracil phosphoribosyltransferase n=1 Tax=Zasmidium cellare TaxID=395010 RepID=A0ABR0ECT1_ZASCE|nr:hypothetical protein PRZ48_009587 [Zasmidium cellare]
MLGFLVTICSIVRMFYIYQTVNVTNITYAYSFVGLWSLVEVYCTMVCCCVPAAAGLVRRYWRAVARNLWSVVTNFGTSSKHTETVDTEMMWTGRRESSPPTYEMDAGHDALKAADSGYTVRSMNLSHHDSITRADLEQQRMSPVHLSHYQTHGPATEIPIDQANPPKQPEHTFTIFPPARSSASIRESTSSPEFWYYDRAGNATPPGHRPFSPSTPIPARFSRLGDEASEQRTGGTFFHVRKKTQQISTKKPRQKQAGQATTRRQYINQWLAQQSLNIRKNTHIAPQQQMSELVIPKEPKVIGLYGLPGSGKSTFLKKLREDANYKDDFLFIEGSEVIASLTVGGLEAFKKLCERDKQKVRREAIEKIRDKCLEENKSAVVAGHFSFWNKGERKATEVWTESDAEIFTHIIYLTVDGQVLERRVERDTTRSDRGSWKADHLDAWRDDEIRQLRKLCAENRKDVMFECVDGGGEGGPNWNLVVVKRYMDVECNENSNRRRVAEALKGLFSPFPSKLDTVLLIDGDKTLAPQDTGAMFWAAAGDGPDKKRLADIFDEHGYTFKGFWEAAYEYDTAGSDGDFDGLCEQVATCVKMQHDFKILLSFIAGGSKSVKAIVVTSGLQLIWEFVLVKLGLSRVVKVIGGDRKRNLVVTPKIKAMIAKILQENGLYVLAFGDSKVDLPMLHQADQAVVVVCDEKNRSKSMEGDVKKAITNDGLEAHQLLLPSTVSARLDEAGLPVIQPQDVSVINALTGHFKHVEAKNKAAAKLLMTPTRDANVHGPSLREAHRNVGRYLATEYLSEILGLQQYKMQHVQSGKTADGYRLFHEKKTLVIPLMRGGEPMAFGVSDVFPLAPFLHAKKPGDVEKQHLQGMTNVILVDGVVNTGDSLVEFVKRIRELRPSVRIVALSGVTQKGAVEELTGKLDGCGGVTLISLRTSANKFTGKGGTDTGARLFCTTEME